MSTTSYHIEKVANGYIVSEAAPQRDLATMRSSGVMYSSTAPHVFESYEAMQKWLQVRFEGAPDTANAVSL